MRASVIVIFAILALGARGNKFSVLSDLLKGALPFTTDSRRSQQVTAASFEGGILIPHPNHFLIGGRDFMKGDFKCFSEQQMVLKSMSGKEEKNGDFMK